MMKTGLTLRTIVVFNVRYVIGDISVIDIVDGPWSVRRWV